MWPAQVHSQRSFPGTEDAAPSPAISLFRDGVGMLELCQSN